MSRTENGKNHFKALASDGDGTLTRGGHLGKATFDALRRLRQAGKRIILTTGETPKDLAKFPHLELFDLVVAENGALLFDPSTRKEELLAEPPPVALIQKLRAAKIDPLKFGRVIVSTESPRECAVAEVLRDFGWQVVLNRRNIMMLPQGINKATGLTVALRRLGLADRDVVAVGDAENDLALFKACGCGVAVANAIPELKKEATLVTSFGNGAGVVELIDKLLSDSIFKVKSCR